MQRGLATALLLSLSCGGPPAEHRPGPAVLIVTLDATRADRLGPYGYPLAETPAWDELAAEGTLFRRAYASSPLTIPSHATIFTGLLPPSHGVRDDGDFVLGDEAVTLAERFREAGWTTAAFTAALTTERRWGLDQGFELYHDPLDGLADPRARRGERRADEVVDDAIAALETLRGPVFAWVHLHDAHWPYDPPEPWASRHPGRAYDGEIAFTDAQAARLLEAWTARFPDGIVVVTADHGEALGDGGEQTHGYLLHDGTIRVPLILRGPGIAGGVTIDDPVGHVDIAPTLLALAGLPPHPGLQGRDLRSGGSERIYSESRTGTYHLGLAPLAAYTDASGRYTEGGYGAFYPAIGDHVLATAEPPPERGGPDLAPRRDALARLRTELVEAIAPTAALDVDTLDALSGLGYVGGDPHAAAGTVDPRDVVDAIRLTWQARQLVGMGLFEQARQAVEQLEARMPDAFGVDLLQAQLLRRRGRLDEAAGAYRELFLQRPSGTVALQLAGISATLGDWVEAEAWYREAGALQPASPEAAAGLARSLLAGGRPDEAEEIANAWLALHPDHPELALIRAELLLGWGQATDALVEARRGLDRLPHSPWAHTVTGRAHWALGEPDEAIARLQDALRLGPYNASVRTHLASCLLEVGRSAEAMRLVAPLARLLPNDPEVARLHDAAERALAGATATRP